MKEKLEQLLETIKRAEQDPNDDALFREVVDRTLRLGVVDLLDAATGLCVSLPTVNRWCMGQSAPHPLARPSVYQWLKKKIEEKLNK